MKTIAVIQDLAYRMFSIALYESIINGLPSGHYLLSPSPDPIILTVNDTFLRSVARKREDLVGNKLFSVFPGNPDDPKDTGLDALRHSLLRVIETGRPDALPIQRYPIKVTTADGYQHFEERFWSAVNSPIFDENGQLLYISHTTTDVTEQVRVETAMKKAQLGYRNLIESIDEGFCLIEMIFDEQGHPVDYRFLEVNPRFTSQTGLHDAVGKRMRELVPEHEAHWFEIYGEVARNGKSIRFVNEARALGRWYDVYAYRVDEPDAGMVGILFRDITATRLQHEAVRLSEGRLRALTNATADIVYRMSPDWTQMHALEGRGFLKDTSGSNELWLDEYVPPEEQERVHKAIENAVHGKTIFELEHRVRRLDGSFGWTYSRAVPMLDDNGEIYEWIGAASDITDRKLAEEKLKEADRRKDDFLAMLAHELRNPLAPIAAAADLLGLVRLNEEKVRQTSNIISRQVRHMTGLVDDLLDVSRVTRGLVKLEQRKVDVKKIIADSVEQVRPLIEARGHQLTVHTPPRPAFVTGDQKRLVQVLTNLLNNAAKYTPEGGTIVLSMEIDNDHVKATVTDNGIGMAPELVKRAFELFAQAERSSDRSQGGLGIGLALVKSLVELHGGSINVASEGIGKGSRFTVCLPALAGSADTADAERHLAVSLASHKQFKVMVVDDNVDAVQMLSMLIEASGHQVLVEYSPGKALQRARAEKPSVCLLDIGLPEMDGKELARRLRVQPETSRSVLVAITGYGREEDRENTLAAGFDHHLVKPVDINKLAAILAEAERIQ